MFRSQISLELGSRQLICQLPIRRDSSYKLKCNHFYYNADTIIENLITDLIRFMIEMITYPLKYSNSL